MRALITGGAGLIGSHIADLLLKRGDDVRILDNLSEPTHTHHRVANIDWPVVPDWTESQVAEGAEFRFGDIRFGIDIDHAMRGIDVVFHQAAFGGFAPEPNLMTHTNASGTANVMGAARKAGVSKVVVASSQAVYGHGRYVCHVCRCVQPMGERYNWEALCRDCGRSMEPVKLGERDPLELPSVYALSKFYAERLVLTLGEEWGLPVVALRYALTYGPRQSATNPYTGICSIFSTRLLNKQPVLLYEDGRQTRDFTFVEDVAAANLHVADDARANGGVFNVGTGVPTTVRQFAETLADAYDVELNTDTPGEWRPADARHLITDAGKLRALGWEPRVDVREGVRRYADWFRRQPLPTDSFSAAHLAMVDAGIVHQ